MVLSTRWHAAGGAAVLACVEEIEKEERTPRWGIGTNTGLEVFSMILLLHRKRERIPAKKDNRK